MLLPAQGRAWGQGRLPLLPPLPQQLLTLIEPTDRGVAATPELREEINGIIEQLEASWAGTDAVAARGSGAR